MENPREDVKEVVLALLDKPTLSRQAEAVRKYCTPDVLFYYLFFNVQGTEEVTLIYQIAQEMQFILKLQILANYQGVKFESICYDEKTNIVNIWTQVLLRPWPLYWNGNIPLSIYTVLELENVPQEQEKGKGKGKVKKMIKVQRDWFEFSPIIRVILIVGDIYANQQLRFAIGALLSDALSIGFKLVHALLPAPIEKSVFG